MDVGSTMFRPSFPSPSAGDLRELPGVPLRGEGSCGGGGAPRDSAGSGAREEGLTSRQRRRGLTLLSQLCRDPAVGVRNAEEA